HISELLILECYSPRTCIFFFSSRRRHTRWPRDWSSDVCSSDLRRESRPLAIDPERNLRLVAGGKRLVGITVHQRDDVLAKWIIVVGVVAIGLLVQHTRGFLQALRIGATGALRCLPDEDGAGA